MTPIDIEKNETVKGEIDESPKSEDEKNKRPNCFLSIPITNRDSLDKFKNLMESMHKTHKDMQRISIPPDKLHLTLGVFNIASDTQLENACLAMEKSKEEIRKLAINHPIQMRLCGIDSFSSGVLFVKLAGSVGGQERSVDTKKNAKKVGDKGCEKVGVEENSKFYPENFKKDQIKNKVDSCGENNAKDEKNEMGENFKDGECNSVVKKSIEKEEDEGKKSMPCDTYENVAIEDEMRDDSDSVTLTHIQSITDTLLLQFKKRGLFDPSNSKPFKPHITVAKSSKASFYHKKKYRKLIEKIKEKVEEQDYGIEKIEKIDLCWMSLISENKTGYKIIYSINLFE